MTDLSLLHVAPLAIPLFGLVAALGIPNRLPVIRRRLYVGVLGLTLVALAATWLASADAARLAGWSGVPLYEETLAFRIDGLGRALGLLLIASLFAVGLSMWWQPMERYECLALSALVVASMGALTASNLLTLCVMFAAQDLAGLSFSIVKAADENLPHAQRNVFTNLLATVALVGATLLTGAQQRQVEFAAHALQGLPIALLMISALLRLNIYPGPGSLRRRWEPLVFALCSGGYLWLRTAELSQSSLPQNPWMATLLVGALLATALSAALSPDLASALPFVLLHGVAIVAIAPLFDLALGSATAFITIVNLVLCLALLRTDIQVRTAPPLGRWARIPLLIALGSLAGWPLTLGFVSRWAFIRLCWVAGLPRFVLLAAVAFLLASTPIWSRLQQIPREIKRGLAPSKWNIWLAFGSAAFLAGALVVTGLIFPAGAYTAWRLPGSWELLLPGSAFIEQLRLLFIIVLTAAVIPLLGSYAYARLGATIARKISGRGEIVRELLDFDWVYVWIGAWLEKLRRLLGHSLVAVEEAFYLGWTLLWSLIIMVYLMGD